MAKLLCLKHFVNEEEQASINQSVVQVQQQPVSPPTTFLEAESIATKSMRLLLKQTALMSSTLRSAEDKHQKRKAEHREVLKWKYSARVLNNFFFYLSLLYAIAIYSWFIVRVNNA